MAAKPKYKATEIALKSGKIRIYASPKLEHAMKEVTSDLTLYKGVRLTEVLDAVYSQGKKDGAREAFDKLDESISSAKQLVPHRNPGKPKKAGR
jgi:hypothetical protein